MAALACSGTCPVDVARPCAPSLYRGYFSRERSLLGMVPISTGGMGALKPTTRRIGRTPAPHTWARRHRIILGDFLLLSYLLRRNLMALVQWRLSRASRGLYFFFFTSL
eukprot:CAMPEP_0172179734 /NCGR_PEP_ID=MMETSP1050-20130122/16794_1 /TAXON_ID=233186 /ORGANISM="Cryptomonas curvata, Strain CCAP979/52" /LENGTH=108 /DNA_ID=CAMNT_0012852673 /DNA_START=475 /DNA_END=801 /DNA_ORIENTATION=-